MSLRKHPRSIAAAAAKMRAFAIALGLSDQGRVAVEFAIVVPVLVVLTLGAVDYGAAANVATKLDSAARAGAQYGANHPADTCGIAAAVRNATNASGLANISNFKIKVFQGPSTTTDVTTCVSASAPVAYYCTCSDSGGTAANCSTGTCTSPAYMTYYVGVSVSATFKPTLAVASLPITHATGLPASSGFTMGGSAVIAFQ